MATDAAIRLRGGQVEQAKALWGRIRAELGGYMPHAAAVALIHAAAHTPPHDSARSDVDATTATSAAERATTREAGQTGMPTGSGPGQPPHHSAGGESGCTAATTGETGVSEAGALVRELARLRGVEEAELANLIRVAAGSHRIPGERAAAQLEMLLERISEPIARRTLEHIETLHPSRADRGPGPVSDSPVAVAPGGDAA